MSPSSAFLRGAIGRRSDWSVPRPSFNRSFVSWIGPLVMAASVCAGWFAFASAGGTVALGLFVGASSITLMAWSFVLAVRLRTVEPLFGGLDSMYQAHRWAGTLAVALMFLHVRIEPEVDGGIRGASRSVADSAEDLAGIGEYMLYGLVLVSILRWFPYRWWRLSHKLLGIPFAFASWHFFTAEKTYANGSGWGWYFGAIMIAGIVSFLLRVIGRDMFAQGVRYRIEETDRRGSTTEIRLRPVGRPLIHDAGQFAVVKIQRPGLREPHVFTIASGPDEEHLRFFVRDLGDWTSRIQAEDLIGAEVFVEGPYGQFEPLPESTDRVIWIAGGVGITPFLSAVNARMSTVGDQSASPPPLLVYCVPNRAEATALHELEQAHDKGVITLEVLASDEGNRFSGDVLDTITGTPQLHDSHVAICGPAGLVAAARSAAVGRGAAKIETEAFDIRSGIGPDLSVPFDDLFRSRGLPTAQG